jgi:hypothetical protein
LSARCPRNPKCLFSSKQLTHFAGFYWEKEHHDAVILDRQGATVASVTVGDTAEGWAQWREMIKMGRAFAEVGGSPAPGSALDQVGLIDGVGIVEDYLCHGEPGIALEHLIYMIHEPRLPISIDTFHLIEQAARLMGMESDLIERVRP